MNKEKWIVKKVRLEDRQRLRGNRRSIEGGHKVYMQRGQNITLTPKGEKQVAVLFSAVMLLQFPVSERGEGVFVHSEPFGSPYICWRGSSLMGIGYQDKLILELA